MAFGGLDIGSSGVKCAFFNERGKRLAFARQDYDYSSMGGIMNWMAGLSGIMIKRFCCCCRSA